MLKRALLLGLSLLACSAGAADIRTPVATGWTTTPFSATVATGTATSSADRTGNATVAMLGVSYSGITGSPATCTLQLQNSTDAVNFFSYGSAISIAPGASAQQFYVTPSTGIFGAAVKYVYACGTYPTGGTLTVTAFYQYAPPSTVASVQSGTWTVTDNQGGTWTDRVVGNAGAAFDAANNAAAPANVLAQGDETVAQGNQPTVATGGNVRRVVAGTDGVQYARMGGPSNWSCFVPLTATATTQCLAAPAAGLRAYVVSLNCSNGAATVQGVDVVYGTGSNCGTGTTALTHKYQMGTNGTTTSPYQVDQNFGTGLVPVAANAICVRPTAATAFGCTLAGYTAP